MNVFIIFLRTLLYYLIFLLLFKIIGKKRLEELSLSDLLIYRSFMQFACIGIIEYKKPIILTILPCIIIVILKLISSLIFSKYLKSNKLVNSNSSVIIKNGEINFKEMERQKYNLKELLLEIHDKGINNLNDIDCAILKDNGELNIITNKNDIPLPLILDGKIQYETLVNIGKDKHWILDLLRHEDKKLNDVFYSFYRNNKCYIIEKKKL